MAPKEDKDDKVALSVRITRVAMGSAFALHTHGHEWRLLADSSDALGHTRLASALEVHSAAVTWHGHRLVGIAASGCVIRRVARAPGACEGISAVQAEGCSRPPEWWMD